MSDTALGAAFKRTGIRPEIVEFDKAITKLLNSGGTIEDARERVEAAAARLPPEADPRVPKGHQMLASAGQPQFAGGAFAHVPQGQLEGAPSRQPKGDAGDHRAVASDRQTVNVPPSPPTRDGAGHRTPADKAMRGITCPAREPSALQTEADIASRVRTLSVFDRELTHTGRRWGNVTYRELDSMREDGDIADAVKAHIGSLRGEDRHKPVRDLMTPREFGLLIRRVRGSNAA